MVPLKAFSKVFKAWKELHSVSLQKLGSPVLSSAEKQERKDKNPEPCNLPTSYVFRICIPSKTDFDYIL